MGSLNECSTSRELLNDLRFSLQTSDVVHFVLIWQINNAGKPEDPWCGFYSLANPIRTGDFKLGKLWQHERWFHTVGIGRSCEKREGETRPYYCSCRFWSRSDLGFYHFQMGLKLETSPPANTEHERRPSRMKRGFAILASRSKCIRYCCIKSPSAPFHLFFFSFWHPQ